MTNIATCIVSAYSFISNLTLEQLADVGNSEKDGIPIPSFEEDILIKLCKEAKEIFKNEDNVLRIDGDVIIVGDIHGSFNDLLRILKYVSEQRCKVLFLGDYVDRGHFSLECITILFAMKVLRPNNFFLIRGNHEFDSICNRYGFKDEIIRFANQNKRKIENRYNENISQNGDDHQLSYNNNNLNRYQYTLKLYNAFIKAFSYLPIASIVNKTTFCIHGGLSPKLQKVDDLNCISRPINSFEENMLFTDILWSDPSTMQSCPYHPSNRGYGYLFNENSVTRFLKDNHLKRVIRAHQFVQNGISEHFGRKCITVFSASSYSYDFGNQSGILRINRRDDSIQYIFFTPIHRLSKRKALYNNEIQRKHTCYSASNVKPVHKRKASKVVKSGSLSSLSKNHTLDSNKRTTYSRMSIHPLNASPNIIHKSFSMPDIKKLND